MGKTAGARPASASGAVPAEPERCGHRRGRHQPFRGGACGPRGATGARVRRLYGGPVSPGGLAGGVRRGDRGHGVHRGVLDTPGVLEERGFQVMLVDPRRIKSVSGRKTDVLDCQWLQQLHTYGLLSGAFRPDAEIRWSAQLPAAAGHAGAVRFPSHPAYAEALTQMNVKLQHVISNITGRTGMDIIEAIVNGERDP